MSEKNSMWAHYIVDLKKFKANCDEVTTNFNNEWNNNVIYGYSVKTNRDSKLLKYAVEKLGWYAEMVSPDEYKYCKSENISAGRMILNGPCKESMISEGNYRVKYINLDNLDEVSVFCSKEKADLNVGLRINFDLEKLCPGETTAGDEVSRFGIDAESEDIKKAAKMLKDAGYDKFGLHLHTSTKTRSIKVFESLAKEAVKLKEELNIDFSFIDMGGGFFGGQVVSGKPSMRDYADKICTVLRNGFDPAKTTLILEPGASVLATCVSYKAQVINVRKIRGINVATINGTLLHLNPFMSKRNQPYVICSDVGSRKNAEKQIICGATCMENDRLAVAIDSPELEKGDELLFGNVGAYTMTFNAYFILDPPKTVYIGDE